MDTATGNEIMGLFERLHQQGREFKQALQNGTIIRSNGYNIPPTDPELIKKLLAQAKLDATRPISIRLSVADIDFAKTIAAKKGIGYQTVLKDAIHRGLKVRRVTPSKKQKPGRTARVSKHSKALSN